MPYIIFHHFNVKCNDNNNNFNIFLSFLNAVRNISGIPYCKIPVAINAYAPCGTLGSAMLFFSSRICR